MELGLKKTGFKLLLLSTLLGVFFALFLSTAKPVSASTGTNQTVNFQGRLLNSAGATVPDGYYNIEFKIYQDGDGQSVGDTTGSPSGALKWTEDYLNYNTQGVKVVNGYLSVNLGSITPFGSSIDWNQSTLWLSMNVAGTSAVCTTFGSCTPDGEMTPMQPLTSAIYALNSYELGGLTASQFGQLAANQTWTGSNVFQASTNSASTLQVNNSAANTLLNINDTATTNLLKYPGFESGSFSNSATGWVATSPGTISQNTTASNSYDGLDSLNLTTTSSNGGAQTNAFTGTVAAGTYFVSFDVMPGSAMNANGFTVTLNDGSNHTCSPASQTLSTSGFTRIVCSATTSSNLVSLKIAQNDGTARTVYIDDVQLESGSQTSYQTNTLQLPGTTITSPVVFKNSANSTSAFQIQNASGSSNLFVADTINSRIGIGTSTPGNLLSVNNLTTADSAAQVAVSTNGTSNKGIVVQGVNGQNSALFEAQDYQKNVVASINSDGRVTSVQGFQIDTNASNAGTILKKVPVGSGGVSTGDPVIIVNNSGTAKIQDTSTARDSRIYGVANTTTSSGSDGYVVLAGNINVNADSGAVNIGDQLVTSTTSGQATVDNSATTGIIGIALGNKAGGSAGVVPVAVNVGSGQYSPTFRNAADSTSAFQIQNAAGNAFVTGDSTNKQLILGKPSSITGQLAFDYATSSGSITIVPANPSTSNYTITLPAETGTVCTTAAGGACSALGFYIQNQTSGTQTANFNIQSAASGSVAATIQAASGQSVDIFDVKNTTNVFSIGNNGQTKFQPTSGNDSTNFLQIQNGAGTSNLFIADTTNTRIGIANNSPQYTLDVTGSINASASVRGQNLVISSDSTGQGYITKLKTVGTGGVTANDVVVLANDSGNQRVIDSTTARDPRVFGVALATTASGNALSIAISGNYQVTADTGAVAIGDQLVVSSTSGQVTVNNNATTGILGTATSTKSTGSSGLVSVNIRPVGGVSTPVYQPTSDSTTAFQIQNAAGNSYITGDSTNKQLILGKSSTTDGKILFYSAAHSGSITVVGADPSTNAYTITLPAETGTVCTTNATGVCSTAGTGYVQLAPGAVQADGTNNNSIFINKTTGTGNILELQKGASDVFTVGNTGNIAATGTYNTNTFSSTQLIFGGASGQVSSASGGLTLQAASGTVTLGSSTVLTAAGALTVQSAGTNTLTLNTAGAGTVNVGTTNSNAVAIGSTSASVNIDSNSTANLFNSNNAHTVNIGAGATGTNNISIGTTNSTSGITERVGTGNYSLDGAASSTYVLGASTTTGTIAIGGSGQSGSITLGQSTTNQTINIGNATTGAGSTNAISVGTNSTGSGQVSLSLGSANGTSTTTIAAGSGNINLNSANIATNQSTLGLFNSTATTVTMLQAATSISTGGTTGTYTIRNANTVLGNAAGSGVLTNNGATVESTLALTDFATGGAIGTAAATVDVYTSISIAQTTAGQTLTIPAPTSSTNYGRLLFLSNIGNTSFQIGTTTVAAGSSVGLIWSNSNGTPSWQFTNGTSSSSSGYVQLAPSAAQGDSTNNNSIYINKTSGTGNILDLQKSGTDTFTVGNTGNITATGTYNTNTFSGTQLIFGGASGQVSSAAGGLTLQAASGTVTLGSSTVLTAAGALNVQAAGTGTLSLNTSGAGTVNLGTTNTTTIGIGNNTAATLVNIQGGTTANTAVTIGTSGTGGITIDTGGAGIVNLGNANATTINLGGTSGSTTYIAGGNVAHTVNIGAGATGTNTINIGTTNSTSGIAEKVGTGNYSLDGVTGSTFSIGASTTTGSITIGGASQSGTVTLGQATTNQTINIGNATTATGNTNTIAIGTSSTGTGQVTASFGSANGTSTTTIAAGSGNINLNSANIATNQATLGLFNANAATVTMLQAATSISTGATTGTFTVRNANTVLGNAAGSGVLTNNGATVESTLALTDFATGGAIGTAAATVDKYTSISVAQTTTGQTLSIPSPTSNTTYGRVLYLSNIGSASFLIGTTPISTGTTVELVWSNTNGAASWQFANGASTTGAGYVQIGPSAAQADSTANNSIFINKTNATGNILELQKTATDVFTVGNTGNITATGTYNTNTFSGTQLIFGGASGQVSSASGGLTLQAASGTVTLGSSTILTANAGLTVQAAGTNTLTLNTVGAGTVNLGTTNTTTIGIGNNTAATLVNIQGGTTANTAVTIGTSGTGGITIDTGGAGIVNLGNANATTINLGGTSGSTTYIAGGNVTHTVNIGAGATGTNTINIGTTNSTSGIVERVGTGNYSLDGVAGSTYVLGASTTTGSITVGGASQTGAITLGQATTNQTINIGNATTAIGNTNTIAIGTSSTGTGQVTASFGSANGTSTTTIAAGSGNINLNSANIATNQATLGLFNANAATVTMLQAATSISTGGTTGTFTIRNANTVLGNAAGSGVLTNNGATVESTLALTDFATGGAIGTAAATVDKYTSISVAQTTGGQTLSIPNPTSNTAYGRILYLSNIGSTNFQIGTTTVNYGSTVELIWSNTNGAPSWQFTNGAGTTASGFVQLAPTAAQTDGTNNSSIFLNKTSGTGNILELQKSGTDTFAVANNGAVSATGAINGVTLASNALTFSGSSPSVISSSTTNSGMTLQANGTGTLLLNTGGAGTVSLGTANTTTIGIGSTTAAVQTTIQGGTGTSALAIQTGNGGTLAIGTSGLANIVNIGNTSSSEVTSIQGGTGTTALGLQVGSGGTISLGTTVQTSILNVGNTSASSTTLINGGTGATAVQILQGTGGTVTIGGTGAASTVAIQCGAGTSTSCGFANNATDHTTTVGSMTGTSLTTIQGGTGGVGITGAVTTSSTINTDTLSATGLTFSGANPTITSAAGNTNSNFNLQANGTGILTLNSTGAGTVNVGTTNTTTVGVGNTTAATQTLIQGGTGSTALSLQTGAGGSLNIGTTNADVITIGATGSTNTLTVGQSTAGETLNLENGATAAATTVNILSGVGTAGTATLKLGDNTRATQIDLGNINPSAARTINIGNSTGTANAFVDTINIATNPTTVAGGNTVHIADGTPTGTGTNLVTIGSNANASTTVVQGGTSSTAIQLTQATGGGIVIGGTGAASTVAIQCGAGTSTSCGFANNATDHTTTVGSMTGTSLTTIQGGTGGVGITGAVTTSSTINTDTLSATGLTFSGANPTITSAAGNTNSNFNLQANGTGILTLNSTGAGTVNVGTTNTTTVGVGNTTAATQTLIQGGTGTSAVGIQTGNGGTLAIGTSGLANIVNIGNTSSSEVTSIQGGTGTTALSLQVGSGGTLSVGTTSQTSTLNLGNTSASATTLINGGTNSTSAIQILQGTGGGILIGGTGAASTVAIQCGAGTALTCGFANNATDHTTTVGSMTGTSLTTIQGGTGGVGITGAVTTSSTINTDTLSATQLIFSGASGSITDSTTNANMTLQGNGTGILTLNTSGSGTVNLGTANSTTIGVGNTGATTQTTIQGGTLLSLQTAASGSTTIATTNAGSVSIGNTGNTSSLTFGQSTAGETINIENSATAAATAVNILSGAGTAGTASLALGNNTRVNLIGIGNVAPAAARSINIGNTTGTANAFVDTINVATNPTTVAGGNTVHIADGTPTGAGTNLVTIGSTVGGSITTIQGGSTGGITLTGNITASGNFNTDTLTSTALTFGGNNPTISSNAANTNSNLTVTSNGTGTLNLNSGASGTVAIGNNGVANTVNLGATGSTATTTTFNAGTTTGASQTLNLGGSYATSGTSNSGTVVNLQGGATGVQVNNTGVIVRNFSGSGTAFQVQNSAGASVLVVDTTNRQLKVYENGGSTNYNLIYYDTATSTANYTANSGTVAVGRGAGNISIASGSGGQITITAGATSIWGSTTSGAQITLQSGSNANLVLGTSGTGYVLINGSQKLTLGSSAGDPATCTAGAVVYNTTTNTLRGCQGSTPAWFDLVNVTTPSLQSVYAASGSSQPLIKLDATRNTFSIQGDNAGAVTDLFNVHAGTGSGLGTSVFDVASSGNVTIQSSAGIGELSTTNADVSIGQGNTAHSTNPIILGLDNYQPITGGALPTAANNNGAMYYNADQNLFQCDVGGYWTNCAINSIQSSYVFEDEFLSGSVGAGSQVGVGALGWNVSQLTGSTCTTAYNQNVTGTGPGIHHDHPGTLRLTTDATATNHGCVMTQGGTAAGTPTLNEVLAVGDSFKSSIAVGTATGTMRVGWSNQTTSTAPTSGLWWQYTGGNLQYCYANNAAATCATAATLAVNTWAEVEIYVNSITSGSMNVTFDYNISGTTTSPNTTTANFDIGTTNNLSPGSSCVTSTTTAQNCYIDYIQWAGFNTSTDGIRD